MKETLGTGLTAVGTAIVTTLLGGWDRALEILLIVIILDYLTGVASAFKSKTVSSSEGFMGLVKKASIFLIVILAAQIDRIQDAFVQAFNQIIDRKNEIIQICEDTMLERCDTSGLVARLAELHTELEIITEFMKRHISTNAHVTIDQAEYQRQYDEYEARYNEAQRRISEAEAHREALTAKRGKLKGYLDMLREQGLIRTFNEALWCGAVEQVRILKDGTMRFIFKDRAVVEG